MKLWLIRHGKTRLSEEGRYQGSLDEGLSAQGREALRKADVPPERLFVSPARRARETAGILFPEAEQTVIAGLREMNFGAFEGRGWWEMERDPDYRAWVESGCSLRCPGGEGRGEYSERVCAAMEQILRAPEREEARDRENTVAIVAHGGTMMAALERWGEPGRDYWQWQLPCGFGWELEWDPKRETLRALGEASFLK